MSDSTRNHVPRHPSRADFLRLWFGEDFHGYVVLWWGDTKKSEWLTSASLEDRVEALVGKSLAAKRDLYFGACTQATAAARCGRGTAATASAMPGVWIDLDFTKEESAKRYPPREVAVEVLQKLPLPPSVIVETGGGFHVYWCFHEPLVFASGEERTRGANLVRGWQAVVAQRLRAKGYECDKTHDVARVLRVPGSWHTGKGRCISLLTDLNTAVPRYEIGDLEQFAGDYEMGDAPRRDRASTLPPAVSAGANRGGTIRKCKRNNTLTSLAGSMRRQGMTESEIVAALRTVNRERCRPPLGEPEVKRIAKSVSRYEPAAAAGPDAKPERAPMVVEPYAPFPLDALPEPARGFVRAAAKAIGCDPSFVALPMLGCLACAIGNKRTIRLKKTWQELAIIWAVIIGKSGKHKSPAIVLATAPMRRAQERAFADHKQAMLEHEQEIQQYERDYAQWKKSKGAGPPPCKPTEPVCQRYIANDITMEALASVLSAQYDGVAVVRDELAGWVDGIAEYKGGKGSDTGHWLAAWSGAPLTMDRKTGPRKVLHVPRASVGLVGGIQPGILARALGREHMQDGMCARLLMTMPTVGPVRWSEAVIDEEIELAMEQLYAKLLSLEPAADGDGDPMPLPLSFTPAAKRVWVDYFNRHRAEMEDLDDDLCSAWSKLEAYTARFALIFELVSWAAGNSSGDAVGEPAVRAAIVLSDWFGGEAKRVYGMFGETDEEREHRRLIEWIERKGGAVTPREVQMGCRWLRDAGAADAALEGLVKNGLGSWSDAPTTDKGGRPSRFFTLSTSTKPPQTREIRGFVDVDSVDTLENEAERGGQPGRRKRVIL